MWFKVISNYNWLTAASDFPRDFQFEIYQMLTAKKHSAASLEAVLDLLLVVRFSG